eukprot:jgi/Mesvir1/12047/Mv00333-RA.1
MLESSLNDRIRVRALPANDPHGPFGAFAGRTSAGDEIGVYGGALVRYYRLPDGDLDTSSAQVKTDGCYRLTLFDGRTYAVCLEADTYCNETAFINHHEGRAFRTASDWRAFGPQTQRVVAALVKDTACVLVGKRYEDSEGRCIEKIPELKPRLGRPEVWMAQPDGPTSAPVFTRCVAIGRTIGLVPLRDFPSTPLAYMPSVDDLNECGLGRARHGSVILETETAADGSQWVRAVALVKTTIARPTVASYHARGLTPAQLLLAARSC